MLRRELAESRNDMGFDNLCLLIRLCGIIREDRRAEIGVVDRVMDGDRNLKASFVGEERTRDASPHRLRTT